MNLKAVKPLLRKFGKDVFEVVQQRGRTEIEQELRANAHVVRVVPEVEIEVVERRVGEVVAAVPADGDVPRERGGEPRSGVGDLKVPPEARAVRDRTGVPADGGRLVDAEGGAAELAGLKLLQRLTPVERADAELVVGDENSKGSGVIVFETTGGCPRSFV